MWAAPQGNVPAPTVLHVTLTSDGSPLLVELVRALHPARFRLLVCALDRHPGGLDAQLQPYGVPVYRLGAPGTRAAPLAAARLAALLRRVRPCVLHTNMFVPGLVGEMARRSSRSRVPSVFTRHHDASHHLEKRRAHVRLDAWTARSATVVVAPSHAVRRTLTVREGVPADKVVLVPHALDLSSLSPAAEAVVAWRHRFEPGPLLVCASRLDPLKGFATLLSALARVVERHAGAQLAVAGAAVAGYEEVLREQARARGVGDRLHLLGRLPDVHALIAASDVYVSASEAEAFGLSVLEAAALGVPLAVTTPGGVIDIVAPEYPALEPGDATGLAAAICARLEDSAGARAVAERVAARVRASFRPELMAEGYAAAYARAIGPPGRGGSL